MTATNLNIEELCESAQSLLREENLEALAVLFSDIHPADIAEVCEVVDEKDRLRIIESLATSTAADVLAQLDEAERGEVLDDMDSAELGVVVSEMSPDDATDLLSDLPEEQRTEVLEKISGEQADQISELLTYDEDTAGGIMTTHLVAVPVATTVEQTIEKLREVLLEEDVHYVFAVKRDGRLAGLVSLHQLLLSDPKVRLAALCSPNPIAVRVHDDQEEVARIISKYDVSVLPVLDESGRLVGRVTHDDIVDVLEEEAEEDIYRMAGLDAAEFERTSIARAAGIRLSWLVPCIFSMGVVAAVMALSQQWFEMHIYASLIIFVPMIAAIGGNCGIQVSTIITRGLATGEYASSRFRTAFAREGRLSLIMAVVCGLAAGLLSRLGLPILRRLEHAAFGLKGDPEVLTASASMDQIALAVGIGMASAIMVAAALGMVLPFVFNRIGVDPAIASGPIVTTTNDVISVTIFLALAAAIIGW